MPKAGEAFGLMKDWYSPRQYRLKAYPVQMEKAPFAVICPGGGYTMVGDAVEGKPYAKRLNEHGYNAFVLRYRTGKNALYPAPMDDLAYAVSYILENADELNVQREGYSVWGSSAGGHLAASFGTENMGYQRYGLSKPAALVLSYPVITMADHAGHRDSRKNLLGNNPLRTELDFTSIERHVTNKYPPTFLWFSVQDRGVSPENGELLTKALKGADVPHEYIQFQSGRHGCGLGTGTECEPWFEKAVTFWERYL